VVRSVKYAWEGVAFCFETQRHMRVHFTIIVLVLLAAWTLGMDVIPFLHLFAAMALVLVAEMFNTALEAATELIVEGYDARAKVVKDVAAGAVLIASAYALTVAVLVFSTTPRVIAVFANLPELPPPPQISVLQAVLTGAILLGIFITWLKRTTARGSFWRGGVISGHSALGFLCAVAIMLVTHDLAIMLLALALAALLAQSRIQARIHTVAEALLGSLAGALVALLLFIWQFN
jgi:diacylglycerol kinase (ATP)